MSVDGYFGFALLRLLLRWEADTTHSGIALDSRDLLLILILPVSSVLQRTGGPANPSSETGHLVHRDVIGA